MNDEKIHIGENRALSVRARRARRASRLERKQNAAAEKATLHATNLGRANAGQPLMAANVVDHGAKRPARSTIKARLLETLDA